MARAKAFIALNIIRAMTIIALLTVMAACLAMLVRTTTASQFFFFAAVTHVITFLTSALLLLSELSLFKNYFYRNWPLLSAEHGLVTLALLMVALGITQLGGLNGQMITETNLGKAIWRLVISSGVINVCLGFVNLVASYVFRDNKLCITARQMRSRGVSAPNKTSTTSTAGTTTRSRTPSPIRDLEAQNETDPIERSVNKHFLSIETNKNPHRSFHPSYYPGSPNYSTRDLVSPSAEPRGGRRPVSSIYSRATSCAMKAVSSASRFGRPGRESPVPAVPLTIKVPPSRIANVEAIRQPDMVHCSGRPGNAHFY